MGQDLRPYVPTTALGLLAMQDRRDQDAVIRGLATLERIWHDEISATALALSLLSMGVYARPEEALLAQLIEHAAHQHGWHPATRVCATVRSAARLH